MVHYLFGSLSAVATAPGSVILRLSNSIKNDAAVPEKKFLTESVSSKDTNLSVIRSRAGVPTPALSFDLVL